MKITTYIKDLIFLWRQINRTEIPKNADAEVILKVTKNNYKRRNSWVRNQVALLIRKIRKEKPYKIRGFSKAKELYESRIPIDLSKVKVGSYVVKYSEDCPVKGKRWCEYYSNFSSVTGIFKVRALDKYEDLVDYRGESSYISLNEDWARCFRFATKEEIQEFKNRKKEYKTKRKEIDKLQEQISKLYKEL